ncbi:MAG TPA: phage tail sheath C-terminal domain-containing protein [Microbacterium sp.]|nr:phage tail sheath C-terminal domain-containing protein [Microbacterium sp.]
MPSQLTYPGVYIEELSSGVRTIVGVSTSVTAFVGRTQRGPSDTPIVVSSFGEFARTFGGLWRGSRLAFAVRDFYANGGSTAVIVRLHRRKNNADVTNARIKFPPAAYPLVLEAKDPGEWGNKLRVRVDYDTRDENAELGENAASLFNLTVLDGATGALEVHRNVVLNVAGHPRHLDAVLQNESALVRVRTTATTRPDEHDHHVDPGNTVWDDHTIDPPGPLGVPITSQKVTTAATDGSPLEKTDFADDADATFESGKKGIFALEDADIVNLLVIPPYTTADDIDGEVAVAAARYATQRRAMYLIDAPAATKTVAAAVAGLPPYPIGRPHFPNVAYYFPRLSQPDPLSDDQVAAFAAAGAVAGVIARTDAQRGVWKAPAGLEAGLNGVPALELPLTDAEIGRLNPNGVNALRSLSGIGRVIWGARTLDGADRLTSEWKYIPVRRTALYIEESLFRGTQWVVFEPNDEPLWAQIRLNVGTFLNDLFRQGAFQGRTPREAYFVKCDKETTTQSDIDKGIVNIHVGFAPLKPAEFVVIRLQQIAGASAV